MQRSQRRGTRVHGQRTTSSRRVHHATGSTVMGSSTLQHVQHRGLHSVGHHSYGGRMMGEVTQRRVVSASTHQMDATRSTAMVARRGYSTGHHASTGHISSLTPQHKSSRQMQTAQESDQHDHLASSLAHGDLNLARGKVLFEERSGVAPGIRIRVMEHYSTLVDPKEKEKLVDELRKTSIATDDLLSSSGAEKPLNNSASRVDDRIYHSFQTLFDDVDELCDDPIITIKDVVQPSKPQSAPTLLPSVSAMACALVFAPFSPQQVLMVGNWGGTIPSFITKHIGADVHLINSDTILSYASQQYAPHINNPKTILPAPDYPDHPFDLSVDAIKAGGGLDAVKDSIAFFNASRNRSTHTGQIYSFPPTMDSASYLSSLFSHAFKDEQTAYHIKDIIQLNEINQFLNTYTDVEQRLMRDLEQAEARLESMKTPREINRSGAAILVQSLQTQLSQLKSKSAVFKDQKARIEGSTMKDLGPDHPLLSLDANTLPLAFSPLRGYDVIIHDSESDPLTQETAMQMQQVLTMKYNDDVVRSGLLIHRLPLAHPDLMDQFVGAELHFKNPQHQLEMIKSVFRHVYWTQPSSDSIVVVATDSPFFSDFNSHPVSSDRVVDSAVSLWERGMLNLECVEQSDNFHYFDNDTDMNQSIVF